MPQKAGSFLRLFAAICAYLRVFGKKYFFQQWPRDERDSRDAKDKYLQTGMDLAAAFPRQIGLVRFTPQSVVHVEALWGAGQAAKSFL